MKASKQWKKSSRWRKAYRKADGRNKARLWNLYLGESLGSYWGKAHVADIAWARRVLDNTQSNNIWDIFASRQPFPTNMGSTISVLR